MNAAHDVMEHESLFTNPEPEENKDITDDVENVSLRLFIDDDSSVSSPPQLFPDGYVNSDFDEEDVKDPPDLTVNQLHYGKAVPLIFWIIWII